MKYYQQGLCALTSHRLQTAAGRKLMVMICPLGENVRLWDLWEGVGNTI